MAFARNTQTAPRVANLERGRTDGSGKSHRLLCHDVDRAGRRAGERAFHGRRAAGPITSGAADPGRVARGALDCLVD